MKLKINKLQTLTTLFALLVTAWCVPTSAQEMKETLAAKPAGAEAAPNRKGPALVQAALLLDTSGSMEGLIDQARCELWNVVNELSGARRGGELVELQIAVYQYGTSFVSKKQGCLRQIVPFTSNLDEVSRGLFSLSVKGGDEYCGQVIQAATDSLGWSESPDVYKVIFIAGNEPFDQGKVTFGEVLPMLQQRSILVNSIYCGTKYDGDQGWKIGSLLAEGLFVKIDHNHHAPKMTTPWDAKMRELNRKMNETFIWFGNGADKAKANQREQDQNAAKMSDQAFANRMSAKIGHLYHHIHHDLVDALQHGQVKWDKMPLDKMPTKLQEMSEADRKAFVDGKIRMRESVRREMADVIAKRHAYMHREMRSKPGQSNAKTWGQALTDAVRQQATERGFTFPKPATDGGLAAQE